MASQNNRVALVLSGGGADGAYEVGVVKALMEGRSCAHSDGPLKPDIYSGTSIGSYNATFLASCEDSSKGVERLREIWLDRLAERPGDCRNGGYRFLANPLPFFDPRCLVAGGPEAFVRILEDGAILTEDFAKRAANLMSGEGNESFLERALRLVDFSSFVSREPFRETLRETIDLAAVRGSSKALRIAATNWVAGILEIFENSDMSDEVGIDILMASTSIPGFFRPAYVDSRPYVDGGLLMNTPLTPAIDAGADELHVVYMDPDVQAIPLERVSSVFDAIYRMATIAWASTVNRDIEYARSINEGMDVLERPAEAAEPPEGGAKRFVRVAKRLHTKALAGGGYRRLTIHRYHPKKDLGGLVGFLNLKKARIEALIDEGFEDAANHDCEESRCVLPGSRHGG